MKELTQKNRLSERNRLSETNEMSKHQKSLCLSQTNGEWERYCYW
jgi:hypothetical protein